MTRLDVTPPLRTELGRLRRLAGAPWFTPVPALVVHALVLLFSDRVWSDMATVHSRTGNTSHIPVAERQLILVGIACALYWLTVIFGTRMFEGRGRIGMRPSTPGERSVAMWMTRVAMLSLIYFATFWLVKVYVFG